MASHSFEIFEGLLNTTTSHLQDFSTTTHHSIRSVYKCVWVLHRHVYQGSSLVGFAELDPNLNLISELSYHMDEHKSLLQICKDLTPLASDSADTYGHVHGPALLLSDCEYHPSESHTLRDQMTWKWNRSNTLASNLIAVVSSEGHSVRLKFLFDKDKFDKRVVVGYWHTFEKILQCVVGNAYQLLQEADFLSDHDRNQIIAWNTPVPGEPQEQTICSRFDASVQSRPEAPAVYAWDGMMTYAELDHEASRVSLELRLFGVFPGNIIPFCMEKSKWALVAALAILKAGAALAPMDPAWPTQRLAALLKATEATIVVCSSETRSCFDRLAVRLFLLSRATVANEPLRQSRLLGPSAQDIAFILFSSGSTGVPKGMIREHGTACTGSIAHAKAMHIDANSRVLQFANHVFDVAMLDFFTTLIVGGCVCIPSELDRRNNLALFIQQSQANWALLTPTVASMLDPVEIPSLHDVTLGGEAITSELLDKWLPYCRVGINYGSAEVDVTHTRDVHDSQDPTNVGKRLSSCVSYIVDQNNVKKILPIGAIGELLISGPTMARSYLKQPERTAASFIPAPVDWYGIRPDKNRRSHMSRAYRMGDLLQQQWDGSFRFVGRRDFQVKINGQKVELGEIESILSTHPSVRLCAVVYPRSGPFTERLVAVVEPQNSVSRNRDNLPEIELEDIQRHLLERVTSYMLPQTYILADPMPLTASLKIDRTKLMMWLVGQDTIDASGHVFKSISTTLQGPELSPDDQTALKLSTMIANLVTNERSRYWYAIHGHENSFSQIGLDSVQVMRLSHLISRTFARKIPVETLTDQHMTVKGLSALIDHLPTANGNPPLRGMTSEGLRGKLSQSLAQIRSGHRNTEYTNMAADSCAVACPASYNVLLSGVTGYLGIQILRALFGSAKVGKVHALVRGADAVRAQARVAKAAEAVNWSIEPYVDRLEIWPGDLSRPRLGLEDSKWRYLTQCKKPGCQIHCLIHCGAVVDWTKSYDDLEASNVTSTVQLLNATLGMQHAPHFTYISGGQYFQPGTDEGSQLELVQCFDDAAASNGYAQTKFISELIVDSVRQKSFELSSKFVNFHIVKPAYLIGTIQDGIANTGDYLWRVVSAAVQQRSYNADEDEQWLLAADVGIVANVAVELALSTNPPSSERSIRTKILHGMKVRDFWSIVSSVTGCDLLAVSGGEWLEAVQTAMEVDAKHVLWPLLDAVEQNCGRLTRRRLPAEKMHGVTGTRSIADAVRKNVEYLVAIGFFLKPITC